jgi:hypothetical protein
MSKSNQAKEFDYLNDDKVVEHLFTEGVLVRLNTRCWQATSSKLREGELKANEDVIHGIKTLIDPDSLADIRCFCNMARNTVKRSKSRNRSKAGYSFLNMDSVVFVPKGILPWMESRLQEIKAGFDKAVEEFIEAYPKLKKAWKEVDPELYDEDLYPSPTDLRSKFGIEWMKFVITMPSKSTGILSSAQYQNEVDQQKKQIREFLDSALSSISTEFLGIVNELKTKAEKGEPMNARRLETIKNFGATFDALNITRNQDLKRLVSDCYGLIGTSEKEDFKEDSFQSKVKDGMKKITTEFKKSSSLKRAVDF